MATKKFFQARLKVQRAHRHISELQHVLSEFGKSEFYRLNPDPDTHGLVLEVAKPMPAEIPLAVGDAVHSLRSALDYIASEIVRTSGLNANNVYFPLHETRENLVDALDKGLIKQASPKLITIILNKIKPYKTGNYPLWALNKIDVIDKHRLLIPVLNVTAIRGINAEDTHGTKIINMTIIAHGAGRFNAVGTGGPVTITNYGEPTFDILFPKGTFFDDQPIIPTLHQLLDLVLGVIETLEAHFFGSKSR